MWSKPHSRRGRQLQGVLLGVRRLWTTGTRGDFGRACSSSHQVPGPEEQGGQVNKVESFYSEINRTVEYIFMNIRIIFDALEGKKSFFPTPNFIFPQKY